MNSYKYKISFRVRHPSMSIKDVYNKLSTIQDIIPGRLLDINSPRTTVSGSLLEGSYADSLCSMQFNKDWTESSSMDISSALRSALDKLLLHENTLLKMIEQGGKNEFFIGVIMESNSGISLEADIIQKIAAIKAEVGMDMYSGNSKQGF